MLILNSVSTVAVLGLVALLFDLTFGSIIKVHFIDDDPIEAIAGTVCATTKGSHKQIGRVSTIIRLVAFLDNLSPEAASDRLKSCVRKNLGAIRLLHEVVTKRNDNVCCDEKISLIEQFHHSYISRTKSDTRLQREAMDRGHAPKLLVLFFYHYATQVASTCKSSLVRQLEAIEVRHEDLQTADNCSQLYKLDNFLGVFSRQLGSVSGSYKTYDEISLVWSFVDKLPMKRSNKYIHEAGGECRCTFATSEPELVIEFQRECATRLKPLYGILVLPVSRLIDLGYYLDSDPFAQELASNKNLRRLMGITQVCEFMLPIRIVKSPQATWGELILLTKEEAAAAEQAAGEQQVDWPPIPDDQRSSLIDLDQLVTADPDNARAFVKSIKRNVARREKVFHTIFEKVLKNIRRKIRSAFGKIFLSRKEKNKYVKTEVAPLIEDERIPEFVIDGGVVQYTKRDQFWDDMAEVGRDFRERGPLGLATLFGVILSWLLNAIITGLEKVSGLLAGLTWLPMLNLLSLVEDYNKSLTKKLV